MLTGDLVRASVKEGKVKPGFISLDTPRTLERAEEILATVKAHIGSRRAEVEEELEGVLGDATDRKLFDGLAKLTFDACTFATESPVPPRELRQKVWTESAKRGPLGVLPGEAVSTAHDVYATVAAELGIPPEAVAEAMYADHPDEQRLTACEAGDARWLINRYNLALVQALLFSAHSVRITLGSPSPARMRQLLRAVKFHQLCFSAEQEGGDLSLVLDGPASLFSQSSRYGLALAKFLPALVLQPAPWSLSAQVSVGRFKPTLVINDATGLQSHYADQGAYETREAEWFRERFEALESGWKLVRDPMPLVQGSDGVVVPDFSFQKGGRVAHLEILGFWRKGTIPKRLAALKKHGPKNLILAVSKRYATDKEGELPDQVIPFAEVIPAKLVLERVEAVAKKESAPR